MPGEIGERTPQVVGSGADGGDEAAGSGAGVGTEGGDDGL